MRISLAALTLAAAAAIAPAAAQQPARADTLVTSTSRGLPRDVADEVTALYNAPAALRATSRLEIEDGRRVAGNVAVLNGPLVLAGHVAGRVVAINADVILRPTARIDGDLLVIGGEVEGREPTAVGGEIRIYRQALRYREENARLVALRDTMFDEAEPWYRRLERHRAADRNWSTVQIATAGAYNRVEGLPINLGPRVNRRYDWGSTQFDGYAIMRTGSSFSSEDNDVGHNLHAEVKVGAFSGVSLGGRLFDAVDPVEPWQVTDLEAGLGAFLVHRDYRDYYQRHGATGTISVFAWRDLSLAASYGQERWSTRIAHDPFTLFHNDANWRPNPAMDDGVMHLTTGTFTIDTRSNDDNPWAGWYIVAEWERGVGTLAQSTLVVSASGITTDVTSGVARRVDYARGFLDLRRYNRLSPSSQLNFRVVSGGWLNGDPLPLERRLSVDGPGAMPGYGFRASRGGTDVGTCTVGAGVQGRPALCDRIALGQVEYRSDFHLDLGRWWRRWISSYSADGRPAITEPAPRYFERDGSWVVFFDAGRGWQVGSASAPELRYDRNELPPLSSFRSDIGGGLDFGSFGVYVAKAISTPGEPLRGFVRLKHRF